MLSALSRRLVSALGPRTLLQAQAQAQAQLQAAPRAHYTGKPARSHVGTAETVIGFTTLTVVMLAPAAWFLANIENFKKRE